MEGEVDVAQRLRNFRQKRDLSIRTLAKMSGLAVNTLSLIENGKTSPSVSTLQQLARALRVPMTDFFEPVMEKKRVVYTSANQRPRATFETALIEDLGAGLIGRAVQPLEVTLGVEASSGEHPIVHTGHECVYCLQGSMIYSIDGQPYPLRPGDSLVFEASLPHSWRNTSPAESRFLLVLVPGDEHDQPIARHFGL
jgi:transcriptional regulator with XRE-family HTH domain